MDCKTEKWNSQCKGGQPVKQIRGLFCNCESGGLTVNKNKSVAYGKCILCLLPVAWQVTLAAVNHIYVFHEIH